MDREYDLVVIGTGSASAAASRCRAAGWTVAVVDYRPVGGTCSLRGCIPKKMLVGAAAAVDAVHGMAGRGVRAPEAVIDWPELIRFKRTHTASAPERYEEGYARQGIDRVWARARFVGRTALAVDGDRLQARHILLATGSMPVPLGIPGEEHLTTSEQFLELDTLPRRLVFVGGGYISFEFAHVAARAGVGVTILHRGDRPLEAFDPDLVGLLVKRTRALGVGVELETEVRGIERTGHGLSVQAMQGGQERRFAADLVVHGAGRVPELDPLDLETGGVRWERRGVTVNEYLQSVSNPAVYAAGDAAASGPPLTPTADEDSAVVATNLLEGNRRRPDYTALATAVFTVPALASVGLTEAAARNTGLRFQTKWQDTSRWFSSRRLGETTSGAKVLIEDGSDRILGAHLLGPHAEELINIFAVAIRFGIRANDLKPMLFAYPTGASDIPHML